MLKKMLLITITGVALLMLSCSHSVEVKPVEIKPIHITIDINVKIDQALDDFFDEIDAAEEEIDETSNTRN